MCIGVQELHNECFALVAEFLGVPDSIETKNLRGHFAQIAHFSWTCRRSWKWWQWWHDNEMDIAFHPGPSGSYEARDLENDCIGAQELEVVC